MHADFEPDELSQLIRFSERSKADHSREFVNNFLHFAFNVLLAMVPATHSQKTVNGLFCEYCLPGMIGSVIGSAHHNSKTIARGVFGKIIGGNGGVLLQPIFGCESFEGGGELAIDLSPCFPKIGS